MDTSTNQPKKLNRLTIDLSEFVEEIDRLAKRERRSRTAMIQTLIEEALLARRKAENEDLIG